MGLTSISAWRAEATRLSSEAFAERLGGPVLVHRARLEGDLHFMGPDGTARLQRPGSTLIHVPRVNARDRMSQPPDPNRADLPDESVYVLDSDVVTVGRSSARDLVLGDYSVSSLHARVFVVSDTDWVFVVDQGSRNGTGHNGRPLVQGERAELITGDEVCFGREVLVFLNRGDLYRYLTDTL